MYVPRSNAEERPEILAAFMRAHPLAALVIFIVEERRPKRS